MMYPKVSRRPVRRWIWMVMAFAGNGGGVSHLRLHGLDAAKPYRVSSVPGGEETIAYGIDLMEAGLSIQLLAESSGMWRIRAGQNPASLCEGARIMVPRIRRTTGFTLVELLVVVTIIGILIGLLLPAVQMARESARNASCRGNLYQFGRAALQHVEKHGHYPSGGWGNKWVGDPDRNDPAQDVPDTSRFGSPHSRGVNFVFCDGSVHKVSYSIDPEIHRRLGNRRDGEDAIDLTAL